MEPGSGAGKGSEEARELRVRLEDIPEAGLEVEFTTGAELVEHYVPAEEIRFELLEPVRSSFHLSRSGPEVRVRGRVVGRQALQCDRCLARIEQPVDARVELTFVPHPEVEEGAQLELSEQDLEVEFYGPEPLIDLGRVIVEELVLAVPYQILCRPACRGLCPRCGADLNREECRCERPADPRLAVLKDFKIKE